MHSPWVIRIFVMVAGAALMAQTWVRARREARKPVVWSRLLMFVALVESMLLAGYVLFDAVTRH